MKAGRELDALIADKVMGLKITPDTIIVRDELTYYRDYLEANKGLVINIPAYSTDIAAAWMVVEKLVDDGHAFDVAVAAEHYCPWLAYFSKSENVCFRGEAATAPLAICLAAIKAVGASGNTQNTMGSSEKAQ